jgi:hypothetical protein
MDSNAVYIHIYGIKWFMKVDIDTVTETFKAKILAKASMCVERILRKLN